LSPRDHHSDYDEATTARCERVLVTLLGDVGPWGERVYLAGGLAPRYIVGELPEGAQAHVGTTDVDLVIGLALGDETPETYMNLETNLKRANFKAESSFRWKRDVEGVSMQVEFMCETGEVEPGHIFKPKGEGTGSGLGAFNVRGAQLVTHDYLEREIPADGRRRPERPASIGEDASKERGPAGRRDRRRRLRGGFAPRRASPRRQRDPARRRDQLT
jgi:hypothetical protein